LKSALDLLTPPRPLTEACCGAGETTTLACCPNSTQRFTPLALGCSQTSAPCLREPFTSEQRRTKRVNIAFRIMPHRGCPWPGERRRKSPAPWEVIGAGRCRAVERWGQRAVSPDDALPTLCRQLTDMWRWEPSQGRVPFSKQSDRPPVSDDIHSTSPHE